MPRMEPDFGVESYQYYNESIKRLVPREKLWVLNMKQDWGPLCDFFGCDQPAWEFPRTNSEDELKRNVEMIKQVLWGMVLWNVA